MTKDQKLESIRQACIKANPQIMELAEGCKIKVKGFGTGDFSGHWTNAKAPIHHENSGYYVQRHGMGWDGHYAEAYSITEYHDGKKVENPHIEILGRPTHLADVLLAIDRFPTYINPIKWWIRVEGLLGIKNADMKDLLFFLCSNWKLKSDDLREQSEETIDFLFNLLK